jgi:hypothetical protein
VDNFFDSLLWGGYDLDMPLYFDGVLKLVSNQSFVDDEGKTVSFYKHYFQGVESAVFEVNGKDDFSKYIDVPCEVQIIAKKFGKDWNLKLSRITPSK